MPESVNCFPLVFQTVSEEGSSIAGNYPSDVRTSPLHREIASSDDDDQL